MITNGLKYMFATSFLILLLANSPVLHAQQDARQLEKQKSRLEKSIEYANFLIDDARKEKTNTLQDLALLKTKIGQREKLIGNYLNEQTLIFDTIFAKMLLINGIVEELNRLKEEYARMINSAYLNHNIYKRLVYVLSAGDLNQAYSRFNYYKYYARQRNAQIEHIKTVEADFFAEVDQLEAKIDRNQQLIANLNTEYQQLEAELGLKSNMIFNLNARVEQLIAEQKRNKVSANKLENEIRQVIIDQDQGRATASSSPEFIDSPSLEGLELSNGFNENCGKLPWPLHRAIICSGFGEQSHPELAEIKIKNNGINFLTHENAVACAVFKGKVTRVLSVPNFNHVVILRHGEFLSVYSNLAEVFVAPGTYIDTAGEIGIVYTDEETLKTELHFEIWNGKQIQDPTKWIASVSSKSTSQTNAP